MITKGIAHTISTYRIQWSRVSATYNRQSISPTSCRGTVAGLSSSSLYRFSSSSNRPRSPFAILKLKTSATEQNIKAAFRKLAKEYHPDLNPNLSPAVSLSKMTEIIQAYSLLMDDDFLGAKVGDGRVALACEMFTLDELRMDRMHQVYSLQILFENELKLVLHGEASESMNIPPSQNVNAEEPHTSTHIHSLCTQTVIEVVTHPEDSVSDLKRFLQEKYEEDWGLVGRRKDRDQISTGWELICQDRRSEMNANSSKQTGIEIEAQNDQDEDHLVMSYHLFVHSYRIRHGDVIHAIVRKYDT